jgi:GTPase SAR1 family protein
MPIDRDLLNRAEKDRPPERQGVDAVIHGLHRMPGLRGWVTIETVALAPVPIKRGERWGLGALLAVPKRLEDGTAAYYAPWGYVEWSWPDRRVTRMLDLRELEDIQQMRQQSLVIKARPAGEPDELDILEETARLNALCRALDALLATPPGEYPGLEALAGAYTGLLPAEMYPYYWALAPSTKVWLRQDAPPSLHPEATKKARATQILEGSVAPTGEKATRPDPKVGTRPPQAATPESQPDTAARPRDLSGEIGGWYQQTLTLAETHQLTEISSSLKSLDARRRLPGFRVMFLGEFNRGKSTLINRLLGRALIPVGALPTTAALTSLVAGQEEQMEVRRGSGLPEQRALTKDAWDDLLTARDSTQEEAAFPQVRLIVRNAWLERLDVEIIDTPGVGDLNKRRTALVFEALSGCDAAVLLVSAVVPFSMTEAAFLEQQVLGRHISRIVVVVSQLDTLPRDECLQVFQSICKRIARVSPAIPVLPAHPLDDSLTEEEALEAVRAHIEAMAAKDDRRVWRSRQVAGRLTEVLAQMIQLGKTGIEAARMNAVERGEALRAARDEVRDAELQWEELGVVLEQRRLATAAELRTRVASAKRDLQERLGFDLAKTPDPKAWWERDLPFHLRRELGTIGWGFESALLSAVARDSDWLQDAVARTFGATFQPHVEKRPQPLSPSPQMGTLTLAEVQQQRLLVRIGSGAATVAGFLLFGPIGSAVSVGTGIIGDQFLGKKLEEQRKIVSRELDHCLDRTLDEYLAGISQRLRDLYRQLAQEMRSEQITWLAARSAALGATSRPLEDSAWQSLIDSASTLRQTILAALAA